MINKGKNKFQKGSAIIVTMLFGTVAVSLTLLIAVYSLNDYSQVSSYDESNTATFANQAITEFALQSYRYNRSEAIACNSSGAKSSDNIYLDEANNLKSFNSTSLDVPVKECISKTNEQIASSLITDSSITTKIKSYYFKTANSTNPLQIVLTRNQSKEFSVPKLNDSQNITFTFVSFDPSNTPNETVVEIEYTIFDSVGLQLDQSRLVPAIGISTSSSISIPSTGTRIRLTPIFHKSGNKDDTTDIQPNATVTVNIINTKGIFDSGVTTIEASTEYGNTINKIITKIDKQSGTIINQGDYVLYGNDGGVVEP